ncbi:MAG: adenylyltransferase/cytidyltransferase family protein [Candidatus Shapirobacteria bacterium]|nr:adenylyltransferase/cytidyltransferase family protein [Candidatus Shapirobacteria bacterium]
MINHEKEFNPNTPYNKIVDYQEVSCISKQQRDNGKITILTTGVYDIFHYKHAESLAFISSLGNFTIVGIPGDLEIKTAANNGIQNKDIDGPIVDYDKRVKTVAHLPYVDLIFKKTTDKFDLVTNIKPNILVQSITSGEEVVSEILKMSTKLDSQIISGNLVLNIDDVSCKILFIDDIIDGKANIIAADIVVEKTKTWQNEKNNEGKFHGSLIKQRIIEREINHRYNLNDLIKH